MEKYEGLALMRKPFLPNQISKLPKPTRAQTDEVKKNFKSGVRCKECGGWHHPKVVHLDYVGHAALTDRLLDTDPEWNWEPVSLTEDGSPKFDSGGGLWIKLTVLGVTRLGYGSAEGKKGGDAVKEIIGDALRNAAMRFGAALDLWHKGDLHLEDPQEEPRVREATRAKENVNIKKPPLLQSNANEWINAINAVHGGRITSVKQHRSISTEVEKDLIKDAELMKDGLLCPTSDETVQVSDCSDCGSKLRCPSWAQ